MASLKPDKPLHLVQGLAGQTPGRLGPLLQDGLQLCPVLKEDGHPLPDGSQGVYEDLGDQVLVLDLVNVVGNEVLFYVFGAFTCKQMRSNTSSWQSWAPAVLWKHLFKRPKVPKFLESEYLQFWIAKNLKEQEVNVMAPELDFLPLAE